MAKGEKTEKNSPEIRQKIKKSLLYSIIDGSFWSVMFGAGERYLSAFAVFLKATNIQIGLLSSLPILFGSLAQFFSLKLTEIFKSRKRFVITAALIQAFSWLLILSVFFLGDFRVYYLILFAVIYWVSGMIAGPAWNSWMGDLVDADSKGKYFSRRNKITGVVMLFSTILAGIILDMFKNGAEKQYLGFAAIFIVSMLSRFASAFFLSKKYEPKMVHEHKKDRFTFIEFIKEAGSRNYGRFVLFLTLMNFSLYIAAPFFAAYVLYDLEFTYIQYMIWLSAHFITKYISLPVWGRLSDRYGTKKILTLSGFLMPLIPLLWLLGTNFYYILLIELYGGIAWAGFELSSFNFVFDTTTPEKRARCVSYFNVLNGVMIFLGATIGSLIIKYNHVFWTKYYLVFLISGILRYAVSIYFLPKLKERRKVDHISYEKMFFIATNMIINQGFRSMTHFLYFPLKLGEKVVGSKKK